MIVSTNATKFLHQQIMKHTIGKLFRLFLEVQINWLKTCVSFSVEHKSNLISSKKGGMVNVHRPPANWTRATKSVCDELGNSVKGMWFFLQERSFKLVIDWILWFLEEGFWINSLVINKRMYYINLLVIHTNQIC